MSEYESDAMPAPSTEVPDLPPEPPAWPKVVGIISIVWGTLMLGCGACGVAVGLIGESFLSQMMPEGGPPMQTGMGPATTAVAAVGIVFDVLLVVAGILLIQRKPIARNLHIVYAILAILLGIVTTAVSLPEQRRQIEQLETWLEENPDHEQAEAVRQQIEISKNPLVMMGGMAFGVCLGTAYPAFCLVWFGLVKRSPADMGAETAPDLI